MAAQTAAWMVDCLVASLADVTVASKVALSVVPWAVHLVEQSVLRLVVSLAVMTVDSLAHHWAAPSVANWAAK